MAGRVAVGVVRRTTPFSGKSRPVYLLLALRPTSVERWCTRHRYARLGGVYSIHATKKLLDRVKQPVAPAVTEPTTALGNWYANVLFWKPQVALFVSERTLLPVLLPLAPAATLARRLPDTLRHILELRGVPAEFVESEIAAMVDALYAKTVSRSVVGVLNEFRFLAEVGRDHGGIDDLALLALELSTTPMGPLYGRHGSPDRELDVLVAEWLEGRST